MNQYTEKQDREFALLCRRFCDKYVVKRGEDGIYEILCNHGDIEPYSFTELMCYKSFNSNTQQNNFFKKLPIYCKITQKATAEIVFTFPNEKLDEIANIVRVKIKRHLTQDQKTRLLDVSKAAQFKTDGAKTPVLTLKTQDNIVP